MAGPAGDFTWADVDRWERESDYPDTVVDMAEDGRWDDDEWVNTQAEISAAEEGRVS